MKIPTRIGVKISFKEVGIILAMDAFRDLLLQEKADLFLFPIQPRVTAGDLFGTREYLKNNYLYRLSTATAFCVALLCCLANRAAAIT
jgi:hypothetical protein